MDKENELTESIKPIQKIVKTNDSVKKEPIIQNGNRYGINHDKITESLNRVQRYITANKIYNYISRS